MNTQIQILAEPPPAEPAPELRFRRRIRLGTVLRELWESRILLRTLAERDIRVRYKQTALGFGWAIITPVTLMIVFTLFFDKVAEVDTGGVPYVLFSYVGLLPWTFFSQSLSNGGMGLRTNNQLLNKVYCPREVFPLSGVVVAAVDTAIATGVLAFLFVLNTFMPHPESIWVPVILLVQVAFTVGFVLIMSISVVYMRDLRQLLPMILQLGLFATPVAYELDQIPAKFQPLYAFVNPLAPVIDGYRRTVLQGQAPRLGLLAIGAVSSTVLLVAGYLYFKRLETGIADVA